MPNRYLIFIFSIWLSFGFFSGGPVQAVPRLDTNFGLNGRVAVELGVNNGAHAVVVQPDGKIVVAGSSSKGAALNFSLLRFNADGSLDTTFNGDGSVITSVSTGDNEALALGLLSDGRIVAAGYSHNGSDRDFALVCYLPDGSRDLTFGSNGGVVVPIGNGNEEITAMTINAEDLITVVGTTEGTAGRVLVTARFLADGDLDDSFGEQGVSIIGVGQDFAAEGILQRTDGSYVISGSSVTKKVSSAMLVGLDAEGVLAYGFGNKGFAGSSGSFDSSEGYGLAEDGEGRLYLAGSVGGVGKRDTAVFRFTKTGKADLSFGDQGVLITRVSEEDDVLYAVKAGKSGVVASGYATDAGSRQLLLVTFSGDRASSMPVNIQNPSIRTSFSEGESVSFATTFDAAGHVIVVGTADSTGVSSMFVAQYTDDTTTDSFTDQSGYSCRHIATASTTDVTQTTTVIVGEISPAFGMTVTQRGMVFSVRKDPVYRGESEPGEQGPSLSTFLPWKVLDGLANVLVRNAVAATTATNSPAAKDKDFIEEGKTANGSGFGTFSARLEKLKPGTTYFARAYALTSEGAVYYGNQLQFRTADACFVATASFGTLLHPGVIVLRDFRDTFLVNTTGGQRLVDLYYRLSPPVADCIARHEWLRFAVRLMLLPFMGFAWVALQAGMVSALLTFIGTATILGCFVSRFDLRR